MSDQKEKVFGEGLFFSDIETQYGTMSKMSFKVEDFVAFLNKHKNKDGWVTLIKKQSQGGKLYSELDTFVPKKRTEAVVDDKNEDLPF